MHESRPRCCAGDGECRSLPDFSISMTVVGRELSVVSSGSAAALASRGLSPVVVVPVVPVVPVVSVVPPSGSGDAAAAAAESETKTGEAGAVVIGAAAWDCSGVDDEMERREEEEEEIPGMKSAPCCVAGESGGLLSD